MDVNLVELSRRAELYGLAHHLPRLAKKAMSPESHGRIVLREQSKWPAMFRDIVVDVVQPVRKGWISTAQLAVETLKLIPLLPANTRAIAGVPRSGMIPASILATTMHLPLWEVSANGAHCLSRGSRFTGVSSATGPIAVVDDTVSSGVAMSRLKPNLQRVFGSDSRYLTAVVYASPEASRVVDIYAVTLPPPHYLEWNLFNSVFSGDLAVDFDGILCEDCAPEVDDDGPRYKAWLLDAPPKFLPRKEPLPLIATARLEKYRGITEAWLTRHGIRWKHLVMGQWQTKAARASDFDAGRLKGEPFRSSAATIFVESCPVQAKRIAEFSGKRVICPATAEVWN